MNLKCWYETKIDINQAIRNDWKYPSDNLIDFRLWRYEASNVFNTVWLKYMSDIGLPVAKLILFYRTPQSIDKTAHVDLRIAKNATVFPTWLFALNWVVGGNDSEMSWFDEPVDIQKPVSWTENSLPYRSWPLRELSIIDKKSIQSTLTLVRTDVPHNIRTGNTPRWGFSIRSPYKETSWNEIVDRLARNNLLLER